MSDFDYEGADTVVEGSSYDRRSDDSGVEGAAGAAPIKMDLPDIERDSAGIPTFIFHDKLADDDRPSVDKKTLEVVLLWREAVMSVGHYEEPRAITVGDALKNDFRIAAEGMPSDRFRLLDTEDGQFVVNWADSMALEVRDSDDELLSQEQLVKRQRVKESELDGVKVYQYKLGLGDRVAVQVGEVTFVLQYVSPARGIPSAFLKNIDYYFTKILSFSFLAHAFMLLALLLTPVSPQDIDEDLFKNPNRFAKLILKEPEKSPKKKKEFELSGSKGGGRHKDKEGKFGKPDKPKKDALASTKGAPKVDPNKREKDRKIAMQSGLLKALSGAKKGNNAASNVFGPGGLGTGINNALGGLRGSSMGDAGGAGGLGTRGTGGGGGGTSMGIGGLGNGTGRGTGGLGNIDLGGRGKGKYKVIPGRLVSKGCLTQQVVLRVITRVQSQAKYCYERELNKNPNLSGKVVTTFIIGGNGAVRSARVRESSMGSSAVEACLVKVVKRLRFPPCAGGGTAEVSYPWIFKSGGN